MGGTAAFRAFVDMPSAGKVSILMSAFYAAGINIASIMTLRYVGPLLTNVLCNLQMAFVIVLMRFVLFDGMSSEQCLGCAMIVFGCFFLCMARVKNQRDLMGTRVPSEAALG